MYPHISNKVAGSIIAIQNYFGISAPLFGLTFDKIGYRGQLYTNYIYFKNLFIINILN